MPSWLATIDWNSPAAAEALRRGRYGMIEANAGRVTTVHLRPWPKLISWPEIWPAGDDYRARGATDRVYLYYNQPRRCWNFLALKFVVSTPATQYATLRAALGALDEVARLKQTDAIVCDASNRRISDRFLKRCGWQAHKPERWRRNYIKRFYGVYPPSQAEIATTA